MQTLLKREEIVTLKDGDKWRMTTAYRPIIILLTLVMSGMVLLLLTNALIKKEPQTRGTVYEALTEKNFYYVRDAYVVKLYGQDSGMSFDLKQKKLFGSDVAIKDGKLYGESLNDWTLEDYYQNEEDYFLDATRHIPIHKQDLKNNHYKQVVNLKEVWSHFESKDVTNDIIDDFKQGKLTQMRVTYNKDFLPTKLEGFYTSGQAKGWQDLFYIDYPYKNQTEFDQAQDTYIKKIESQPQTVTEAEDD